MDEPNIVYIITAGCYSEKGRNCMTDREKVIRGLEAHANFIHACTTNGGAECPYYNDGDADCFTCSMLLSINALALLKEQEAKLQKAYEVFADIWSDLVRNLVCDEFCYDDEQNENRNSECDTQCPKPKCLERYVEWLLKKEPPKEDDRNDNKNL